LKPAITFCPVLSPTAVLSLPSTLLRSVAEPTAVLPLPKPAPSESLFVSARSPMAVLAEAWIFPRSQIPPTTVETTARPLGLQEEPRRKARRDTARRCQFA